MKSMKSIKICCIQKEIIAKIEKLSIRLLRLIMKSKRDGVASQCNLMEGEA